MIAASSCQVGHEALRPRERMTHRIARQIGLADDLTAIVCALRPYTQRAAQATEVGHFPALPEKRIDRGNSRGSIRCEARVGSSDDYIMGLTAATGTGNGVRTTQAPDILNLSVLPEKCAELYADAKDREWVGDAVVGDSGDLTAIIDVDSYYKRVPSTGSEVDDFIALPENSAKLRETQDRINYSLL